MSNRALVSASLLGLASIAACQGGGGSAGTADSFITQYCTLYSPCCAQAGLPTDGKQCRAVLTAFSGLGGTYDANAGSACLTQLNMLSSNGSTCANMDSATMCNSVYKGGSLGTKAPGAACMSDNECAASSDGRARCVFGFSGMAETQTCQIQVVGKAGDMPCIGTIDGNTTYSSGGGNQAPPSRGYTCNRADNIRCDSQSTMCTAIQDVGGACTFSSSLDNPCVKTAYCDTMQMKCVQRLALGATCDTFSDQCAAGAYCDSTSKKCTTALADGASCTMNESCVSRSCVNTTCAKSGSNDISLQLLCGKSA
jgi:hypothetical protein